MVTRSFIPVGQGAFYREKFGDEDNTINVVYDCGTLYSKKVDIEDTIRKEFNENEDIDAVFISHLDRDHFSGIGYLVNYCNVKRIYLPLMNERSKILMKIKNKINVKSNYEFIYDFIDDPYTAFGKYGLISDDKEVPEINFVREGESRDFKNDNYRYIDSGKKIAELNFGDVWEYIPYNFRQEKRMDELESLIEKKFNKTLKNDELKELFEKNDLDKLIEAYRGVKGSFNTNSMVLFSGIRVDSVQQQISSDDIIGCKKDCILFDLVLKFSGALYTGDYDMSGGNKWKDLKDKYKDYWKYIGCIQVPHHGSFYNYNEELSSMQSYFVMSASTDNKFHHPSHKVLVDILSKEHFPFVVTENKESRVDFKIDW